MDSGASAATAVQFDLERERRMVLNFVHVMPLVAQLLAAMKLELMMSLRIETRAFCFAFR